MSNAYHPYLDGLRAIAVGLVIVFHMGHDYLPSGFIGVDIFFVLSGYLITQQLVAAIDTGSFRFRDFYTRRLRRLVPAYVFLTVICFVVASIILLPEDMTYFAKLAGLGFLSLGNFYLANTTEGYFARLTEEIPYLHTWSLSVEEQFYFIWPLLLMGIMRFGKGKVVYIAFILIFVVSLWFSQYQVDSDLMRAYYLLPSRFFELLCGAALAMGAAKMPKLSRRSREIITWLSVGSIVAFSFTPNLASSFPGFLALIPCVATAALIYAGRESSTVNAVLSHRLLVGVGLISYSLYLWHWPIFAFIRYFTGELVLPHSLIGVLVAIAMAYCSWRFVENPFRYRWKWGFRKTFAIIFVIPLSLLLTMYFHVESTDGMLYRFGDRQAYIGQIKKTPEPGNVKCSVDSNESPCKKLLLAGDSHAGHFIPFIEELAKANNIEVVIRSQAICTPLQGVLPMTKESSGELEPRYGCLEEYDAFYSKLRQRQFDYIVLGSYWASPQIKDGTHYLVESDTDELSKRRSLAVLEHGMRRTLSRIVRSDIVPVVLIDNATIPNVVLKCSFKRGLFNNFDKSCSIPKKQLTDQQQGITQVFEKMASEFPTLRFVDPNDVLCDEVSCVTEIDGVPIYRDDDHLNAIGSRLLGVKYLEKNSTAFAR